MRRDPLTSVPFGIRSRRGATVVEFAITCPLALLLILGIAIGGLGVFRYQQIAHLAHVGARYASVHGGQYEAETGQTAATQQSVKDYIVSQSIALGLGSTTMNVETYLNVT